MLFKGEKKKIQITYFLTEKLKNQFLQRNKYRVYDHALKLLHPSPIPLQCNLYAILMSIIFFVSENLL